MADYVDLGNRIKACADLVGGNDSLSAKTGIPIRTLSNYIAGQNDVKSEVLVRICRTANVSIEWLATGYGSKTPRGVPSLAERDTKARNDGTFWDKSPEEQEALDAANMQGFVALPVLNVTASAGAGSVALAEDQIGVIKFDRAWLFNTFHLNPADLFTMATVGDSMEPTIHAGEYLLASRAESDTQPGDGIYIIRLEGDILVKRLQRLPGGKLMVSSDNDNYQPYEVKLDDGVDLKILGKVVLVHGVRRV